MKIKILALNIALILLANCSMAQNYIQLKKDTEINEIKLLRGEIYQLVAKGTILFGDTQRLFVDENNIKLIQETGDLSLVSDKFQYVKKIGNSYHFDLSILIKKTGHVKLVRTKDNIVTFFKKKQPTYNNNKLSSTFRIIAKGLPSIVYTKDGFNKVNKLSEQEDNRNKAYIVNKQEDESNKANENEGKKNDEENKDDLGEISTGLTWWQYLIIIHFLLFVLLNSNVVQLIKDKGSVFLSNRSKGKKNAQNNGSVKQEVVDTDKDSSERLETDDEILTKFAEIESNIIKHIDLLKNDGSRLYQAQQSRNDNNITQYLNEINKEIKETYKLLQSNNAVSQQVDNLKKEIENKNQDYDALKKKNEEINNYKLEIEKKYSELKNKVMRVDCLEQYAEVYYEYLVYCQRILNLAVKSYNKIDQSETDLKSILSHFLAKFNISNQTNSTNAWFGVIVDIKYSKTTANIDLIKRLEQIQDNDEKIKIFKRIIFENLLETYSSSIFILVEELSNITRFINSDNSYAKMIDREFSEIKLVLKNKINEIGMELNYVPLLESYVDYARNVKSVTQTCSLPYKNLDIKEKDIILEIISYGFGSEPTDVILT